MFLIQAKISVGEPYSGLHCLEPMGLKGLSYEGHCGLAIQWYFCAEPVVKHRLL